MSNLLRAPSLGPIIGHTTATSTRVWMRGHDETSSRTIGIAALFDRSDKYVAKTAQYIRLHREYDRTGVADFDALAADREYRVRMGSLTIDSVDDTAAIADDDLFSKLPKPDVWVDDLQKLPDEESLGVFTTAPETNAASSLAFIFGSCRYPGLFWAAKKSDEIFGSIRDLIAESKPDEKPRFVMMIGDQIYADKLNKAIPLERADTVSEFHDRYVTAFGSPNMRSLLRQTPTYMILDDHEIEDNWVQGRLKDQEKRHLFQMAISAYMSYQWLHCPRNYDSDGEVADRRGRMFYYSFQCGGYPFFVMDSRTQRIRDDEDLNLEDNHLLGFPAKDTAPGHRGQIDLLCDWLITQQAALGNRPKFVVSPSVFAPNGVETAGSTPKAIAAKCADDSWAAFPATRRQLLQAIVDNKVQNVIFLSGDVHCANTAELTFTHKDTGPLDLRALCVTSSAFYWPWPFADGDPLSFVHDSTKEGDDFAVNDSVVMSYRARNFNQEDNFTRIDVTEDTLTVRVRGRDGRALQKPIAFDLA